MISETIDRLVRDGDLTKIENYDKAVADKTQVWECHHRLELTLDGEFAHSMKDLIRLNMYFKRPYFELIFLTITEHHKLHGKGQSDETKKKWLEANKGKIISEEHKKKLSKAIKGRKMNEEFRKKVSEGRKGMKFSEEHKKNLSKALKGRKISEEHRKRMSETFKNKPKSEFGRKYFEHYGYSRGENLNQYYREVNWYRTHNNKCRWE